MKIHSKLPKLQMGGAAPMPEEAPVNQAPADSGAPVNEQAPQQGGGDPLMQIADIAAQALQTQDCQAAMAVCEAFLQLVQQAAGGAPAPEGPAEPTFQKKGGRLVRRG